MIERNCSRPDRGHWASVTVRRNPLLLVVAAAVFWSADGAVAGEVDAGLEIARRIDSAMVERQAEYDVSPAPVVAGRQALRRLTLDLAGRVPTYAELMAHDQKQAEGVSELDLRKLTVDRLLASPDFAYQMSNELNLLLMPEDGGNKEFRAYLLKAVQEGRPWDQMFQDMVGVAPDETWNDGQQFLKVRIKDVHRMTNDSSRLFFGVSINCAQCHDHPLVADWLQDHYFGLQTFFSRTYLTKKNTLAEKYSGEVKFKTTEGTDKLASFMFLTGQVVEEPEVEKSDEQKKKEDAEVQRQMKDDKAPAPEPPAFSPRSELVKLALQDEKNRYLARSIINRLWARLLGRGFVDPPDQMHSENEPSHPELLAWLAEDLVEHGYDLKRTLRGIVLSDTYMRSTVWSGSGERPMDELFAVGQARVLTPAQYSTAMMVAASSPDRWTRQIEEGKWSEIRQQLEQRSDGWTQYFDTPGEHFQVPVDEALLMSNSDRIQNDLLSTGRDRLVGHMDTLDTDEAVEFAFQSILSRSPEVEEKQACIEYLKARDDRKIEGIKQIAWALLTNPELRFNY